MPANDNADLFGGDDDDDFDPAALSDYDGFKMGDAELTLEKLEVRGEIVSSVFANGAVSEISTAGELEEKVVKKLVLRVSAHKLEMWPLKAWNLPYEFLAPKYGALEKITVMREGRKKWPVPQDLSEVDDSLAKLPSSFVKRSQFGFGLKKDYEVLLDTLQNMSDIDELVLTDNENEASIKDGVYSIGLFWFEALRKGIDTIRRRYRKEARGDITLLAYSNLLTKVDQSKFPVRTKEVKPNALYELVQLGGANRSKEDLKAALSVVKEQSKELVKSEPIELLKLKNEIELVTLDELILRFEGMMKKKLPENTWQTFFEKNPFILSLIFTYPIIKLHGHASVGGMRIDGGGEKITDFLFRNMQTGNLALIEIKRPDTNLLYTRKAYRGGVFRPSDEISGAVTQILDQRFQLQTDFATLAYKSNLKDTHPYAVHCIVIAGTTPESSEEKKSLELFRSSSKEVFVVTFDETLIKLKEIRRIMDGSKLD